MYVVAECMEYVCSWFTPFCPRHPLCTTKVPLQATRRPRSPPSPPFRPLPAPDSNKGRFLSRLMKSRGAAPPRATGPDPWVPSDNPWIKPRDANLRFGARRPLTTAAIARPRLGESPSQFEARELALPPCGFASKKSARSGVVSKVSLCKKSEPGAYLSPLTWHRATTAKPMGRRKHVFSPRV